MWTGFNMDNGLARFLAYGTFLVDGNVITNEMSIGSKTPATGPNPPAPAIVGGLDTHAVFGDVSGLLVKRLTSATSPFVQAPNCLNFYI